MNRRILVTGATSTVGRLLVRVLRERKANFIAGVTNTSQVIKMKEQGIRAVQINLADRKTLFEAMKGTAVVFVTVPHVEFMLDWARNLLSAALESGVQYLVRSSILGADVHSTYQLMKVHGLIDKSIKESGMRYTIIHPNTFMQGFATYHSGSIRDDGEFRLPQGYGRTSYVDARDMASVAAHILVEPEKHKYNEYDVTGDAALTNNEVADVLSAVTAKRIRYVPIDDSSAVERMKKIGMSEWMIETMMSLHRYIKDGRSATIAKTVKEITGTYPVTMEEFAKEFAHIWKTAS